jgi:hypothetical protein
MSLSGGAFPASIVPAQKKMALPTNFLEFNTGTGKDFFV